MRTLGGWWRRLVGGSAGDPAGRVTGPPRSSNGASSFHLRWDVHGSFAEVSVTFEVLEPPVVDRLYFWALQADFADSATGRPAGGAHLGLQWHPGHPGRTAVNWGGYDDGGELQGSRSTLPSATGNPNTRDLTWAVGVPYRLTIRRAPTTDQPPPEGAVAWRGTITDLRAEHEVDVRDLYVRGDVIRSAVMWSEVFARCDDPSVAVRWSDPAAIGADGHVTVPDRLAVNYQTHHDGGCANTDVAVDGTGVVQRTTVPRTTPLGALVRPR